MSKKDLPNADSSEPTEEELDRNRREAREAGFRLTPAELKELTIARRNAALKREHDKRSKERGE